jgi:hypothetical protein
VFRDDEGSEIVRGGRTRWRVPIVLQRSGENCRRPEDRPWRRADPGREWRIVHGGARILDGNADRPRRAADPRRMRGSSTVARGSWTECGSSTAGRGSSTGMRGSSSVAMGGERIVDASLVDGESATKSYLRKWASSICMRWHQRRIWIGALPMARPTAETLPSCSRRSSMTRSRRTRSSGRRDAMLGGR